MSVDDRASFLGFPVDTADMEGALEWIRCAVTARIPRQIAVINANKLYLACGNPRLAEVMRKADLVIPEWAVVWGARRLCMQPLHHVGGITLARALLPMADAERYRIYLLGATTEVVTALARRIRSEYPNLVVAGVLDGYCGLGERDDDIIADIRAARPDILYVAVGSPKQELWIHANKNALGVPVSIGLGGTFDVLSGLKKDTPAWARGSGLEWLYRLARSPRAYGKRYLVTNTWFLWQLIRERFGKVHAAP